jgi:hypothetical protein
MSCDYNGWNDAPEDEREALEAYEAAAERARVRRRLGWVSAGPWFNAYGGNVTQTKLEACSSFSGDQTPLPSPAPIPGPARRDQADPTCPLEKCASRAVGTRASAWTQERARAWWETHQPGKRGSVDSWCTPRGHFLLPVLARSGSAAGS